MDEISEENYSQTWADDDRARPSPVGDEREVLAGLLDYYRRTFELKCAGLSQEQMSQRALPPSDLSLHGLVRHLGAVERWWFRIQLAGETDLPMLYYSDDDPDQDFEDLGGDVDEALTVWRRECQMSREIVARAPSLDVTGSRFGTGEPFTLRWLLAYLLAEYAQHCGHADLLRERIDGRTGH